MSKILDGVEVAKAINLETVEKVNTLKAKNIFPCLAIIRVGNKEDAISYQNSAKKRYDKLGIKVREINLQEKILQEDLISEILKLNEDNAVHGILLLRPLPAHLDESKICNIILPQKDIDGMSDTSIAALVKGDKTYFSPCTAEACIQILKYYNIELDGKNVVVIGRSTIVGKPVAMMLLKENATVTICHTHTKDLQQISQNADIVIVAVGKPKKIGKEYLKQGQTVIDVGINMDENNKLCGDVNFDEVGQIVKAISPVPKGVGSITTAILARHLIEKL